MSSRTSRVSPSAPLRKSTGLVATRPSLPKRSVMPSRCSAASLMMAHRDRQQRRGALRPIALNRKNALFAGSNWGRAMSDHRHIDRDLHSQCSRSARLSDRRHQPHCERPSQQPGRRTLALLLRRSARTQGCGLRTPLTPRQLTTRMVLRRPVELTAAFFRMLRSGLSLMTSRLSCAISNWPQ